MLDPFIGFCKEGNLTVEHSLPPRGVQQEPTSVNILVFYICQLKVQVLNLLFLTSQFHYLFQHRGLKTKDAEKECEDGFKHEQGSG